MSANTDLCYEANATVAFMLHRVKQAHLPAVSVTLPQRHYDALVDYAAHEIRLPPDVVIDHTEPRFMGLPVRIGDRFEIGVSA